MSFGDLITDTVIASLVTAIATVIGSYFLFRGKLILPRATKLSLDAATMKKYDDLMNQQLEREEELREQLRQTELNARAAVAEQAVKHAREMAAMAERLQGLELAIHGDYLITVQFATLPEAVIRNSTIQLLGKKTDVVTSTEDPGTPSANLGTSPK